MFIPILVQNKYKLPKSYVILVSRGEAYEKLSLKKPPSKLMMAPVIFSMAVQIAVQAAFQVAIFVLVQIEPWYVSLAYLCVIQCFFIFLFLFLFTCTWSCWLEKKHTKYNQQLTHIQNSKMYLLKTSRKVIFYTIF